MRRPAIAILCLAFFGSVTSTEALGATDLKRAASRWVGLKRQQFVVDKKKFEFQLYRRFLHYRGKAFAPADIGISKLPKNHSGEVIRIDEFMRGFDRVFDVESWIQRRYKNDIYFEGESKKAGKLVRIYFSQSKTHLVYSFAYYRKGYAGFLGPETLAIQHAMSRKELGTAGSSRSASIDLPWLWSVAYADTPPTESSGGSGDSGGSEPLTSLDQLSEQDVLDIINGLKSLQDVGPALSGFSSLGEAMKDMDPDALKNLFDGLGGLGGSLSDLAKGLSGFGNSGYANFLAKNPVAGAVGTIGTAKVFNHVMNLFAKGLVDGTAEVGAKVLGFITGKTKRDKEEAAYKSFYDIKLAYDQASEKIFTDTRKLNQFLEGLQAVVGKNISLEEYFEKMEKISDFALTVQKEKQLKLIRDLDFIEKYREKDGNVLIPDPEGLEYMDLTPAEKFNLCIAEVALINEDYRQDLDKQIRNLKMFNSDKSSAELQTLVRPYELRKTSGLTEEDFGFQNDPWVRRVLEDASCSNKIQTELAIRKDKAIKDHRAHVKNMAECGVDQTREELKDLMDSIKLFEMVARESIQDKTDIQSFCRYIQDLIDRLFAQEASLDSARRSLLEYYPSMASHDTRQKKKQKPYRPDKDESALLSDAIKQLKDDQRDVYKAVQNSVKGMISACNDLIGQSGRKVPDQTQCNEISNLLNQTFEQVADDYAKAYSAEIAKGDPVARSNAMKATVPMADQKLEAALQDGLKKWNRPDFPEARAWIRSLYESLKSYRNTLQDRYLVVQNHYASKKTDDYRDFESGSAEYAAAYDRQLSEFVNRVRADMAGVRVRINADTSTQEFVEAGSRSVAEIRKLRENGIIVEQLCRPAN